MVELEFKCNSRSSKTQTQIITSSARWTQSVKYKELRGKKVFRSTSNGVVREIKQGGEGKLYKFIVKLADIEGRAHLGV